MTQKRHRYAHIDLDTLDRAVLTTHSSRGRSDGDGDGDGGEVALDAKDATAKGRRVRCIRRVPG